MQSGLKSFRFELKAATDFFHRKVEALFRAQGLTGNTQDYENLLAMLLCLYRPLEAALGQLDWKPEGLDISERRKASWLEADLINLGRDPSALKDWPAIPEFHSTRHGLGALYVLEGASLGGQVISRWAQENMGISAINGGRFFRGYGERVSVMWRSFLDVMEHAAALPGDRDIIKNSAIATFQLFDECLAANSAPQVLARNTRHGRA